MFVFGVANHPMDRFSIDFIHMIANETSLALDNGILAIWMGERLRPTA